jgi:hypothetical protein
MTNNLKGFAILMGCLGILALPQRWEPTEGQWRIFTMVTGGVAVTHVFIAVNRNN